MSVVNLVSGGLDSTLISVMTREEGVEAHPLFIDYGQRAARKEWETCMQIYAELGLPVPTRMDLSGFGTVIHSGLTSRNLDLTEDAFTPGRNLMFLLMGSAFAHQLKASAVSIGLLNERFSLFPDQRVAFIEKAEEAIEVALGHRIAILTPLASFTKSDVVRLAGQKGISGTYSCHSGADQPCGQCIACREFGSEKER